MQRIYDGPVRDGWQQLIVQHGLVFNDTEVPGELPDTTALISYWREGSYYAFLESETNRIAEASAALFQAAIAAFDKRLEFEQAWHGDASHLPGDCLFHKLAIPEMAIGPIFRSWQLDQNDGSPNTDPEHWPSLYGRFDLCLVLGADGEIEQIKLLEFNADTPTSVVETAQVQWQWLLANGEQLSLRHGHKADQWNELYEQLVERWIFELSEFQRKTGKQVDLVHVACSENEAEGEDEMTIAVIGNAAEDAAKQMGRDGEPAFRVKYISMESIRRGMPDYGPTSVNLSGDHAEYFTDGDGERIRMIFKLYPWEHMLDPEYSTGAFPELTIRDLMGLDPTIWIEPPYKMLWSNKGLLAVLWDEFKDDPEIARYLLPAYFSGDPRLTPEFMRNCAKKPLLGREGASVTLYQSGELLEHGDGYYGTEGFVYQELATLPAFEDPTEGTMYAVLGLWMVGDEPVGMCIRESRNRITNNTSHFVPHAVLMGV